jgi:predicted LPLAT superfamily acyltransferase
MEQEETRSMRYLSKVYEQSPHPQTLGEKEVKTTPTSRWKHAYRLLRRFWTAMFDKLAFPAIFRPLEEYRISTTSHD